jgi:hypothetical protein
LRGTLIGNSEEKKKKPPAAHKLRINTPFKINHGQCDRDTEPCGRMVRKHVVTGPTEVTAAHSVLPTTNHLEEKAEMVLTVPRCRRLPFP